MTYHPQPHQLFGRPLIWWRGPNDWVPCTLVLPIERDAGRYRVMVEGETEPRWVEDTELAVRDQHRHESGWWGE